MKRIVATILILCNLSFTFAANTIEDIRYNKKLLSNIGYNINSNNNLKNNNYKTAVYEFNKKNLNYIIGENYILNNADDLSPQAYDLLLWQNFKKEFTNFEFKKNLKLNSVSGDVTKLQKYLNYKGYIINSLGAGSLGNEGNNYGAKTVTALGNFQAKFMSGVKYNKGQLDENTRDYINRDIKNILSQYASVNSYSVYQLNINGLGLAQFDNNRSTCTTEKCLFLAATNTKLTLSAYPTMGSYYTNMQGICNSTSTSCALDLKSGNNITVNFDFDGRGLHNHGGFMLYTSVSGPGKVTGISMDCPFFCNNNYATSTVVKFYASSSKGANFIGWTGDCRHKDEVCEVKIDRVKYINAYFK